MNEQSDKVKRIMKNDTGTGTVYIRLRKGDTLRGQGEAA